MSGHSKWHNIQRRKGRQDAIRGQLFTKLSKDIYHAAKEGGGNPDTNFRLKVAIERAKRENLPADSIARTIAKATGSLQGAHYEEVLYEGYGPGGVAILLDIVTDNRNRTAADIRHIFKKRGGNLGESGSVAWMFRRIGRITLKKDTLSLNVDELMLQALDAGADDLREDEDEWEIVTSPENFTSVRDHLEKQGLTLEDAEYTYEAVTPMEVDPSLTEEVLDLLESLEAHDDVQSVYTNAEL
ncbi:YebC/PmpR family DNA-binding transcriptional regulator [Alicyclobacillus sp. TC]|uniref:YebC/PmpR family DNA-binding transcriptional regulator n=1 Tax=Alicyclobacillus sp. TC TaxID=2606450 RepID=UPI0019312D2E|nr:YebC/PmpR family DNA-binding transcriptional regulator [Alicyclobacillus sp. TC]QRF23012.1 YebC/PmpR family DNA-binding transcriptional regulator [Alicyclobacillus sp. TC]